MKHKSQEQLRKIRMTMAIQGVIDYLKVDNVKNAIVLCQRHGITAQQFGQIVLHSAKEPKQIYEIIKQ